MEPVSRDLILTVIAVVGRGGEGGAYRFFRMIIPRIMLAMSDPCEGTRAQVKDWAKREVEVRWRQGKLLLLIWRSCVTAWRCGSSASSCWSRWLWKTWSPSPHSFWTKERREKFVLQIAVQTPLLRLSSVSFLYLMGIVGFFLPKLVSKMKPSNAMKRNWVKVIKLPDPGYSLGIKNRWRI